MVALEPIIPAIVSATKQTSWSKLCITTHEKQRCSKSLYVIAQLRWPHCMRRAERKVKIRQRKHNTQEPSEDLRSMITMTGTGAVLNHGHLRTTTGKRGMYPKLRHPSCIPNCPASAVFRQNCKNLRKGIVTSVVFDCVACIPHFGNLKGCDARSLQGPGRRNTEARIVNRGQAGKQRSAGCRGLSRHS